MSDNFIHLHVHTQYSLLDGAIRIDRLIKRAQEFGMQSVAITDHGSMFGVIEFYEKAKEAKLKPIIGCECYLAPRSIKDKSQLDSKGLTHLILLAKDQEGYKNLCRLTTIANLEGFYYKPRIDKEILRQFSKGLIGFSACLHGEIPKLISEGKTKEADESALMFLDIFGEGNFFLEVQNNGILLQETINHALLDMSSRLSIPLIATNDCHYLDQKDVRAHDVLLCIQTGKTVNEKDRLQFDTDQLYFKSPKEMINYFKNYPNAIENTVKIAERCNVEFNFNTYHFPKFNTDNDKSIEALFEEKVYEGFDKRIKYLKTKHPELDLKIYEDRLKYEISMINNMGFPSYFLIVSDFISYSKNHNIPVGPGRGSAAGSLVAYSLEITDLDPIEHNLIFERFLNPARKSMPDIDVDFCINGREEVFKYVVNKYGGGDYVAQIITFGKLKTRAVIRDVGRALDVPLSEVDAIAKMVPDVINISLEDALREEPKLMELAEQKPEISELIDICRVLEGLPRHASTHAAGVVISDKPLYEYLPLYRGKKGEVITQFDMKYVEKIGLVKFDFLGLRNLTAIADTLLLIAKQGKIPPALLEINLNDKATYDLLSTGDTTGVFQLESSGMKDLLCRMKPACFDDVTALVALYRPGPLDSGMVHDFVERKHGRQKVEYLVPQLESILKETYGVIVYQEQVMRIASVLANYSMSDADDLRKAMGKKITAIMTKHREKFVQGASVNSISEEKAQSLFDLMEKFGGYGFNKSHSAAYALIAYQTAFLKAHFPVELMAALLTSEMHSPDDVVKYISECRNHSIPVLPPDINESDKVFTVVESKIRFGLVAIKNVGEAAIESILEARSNKKFTSIFDFVERVDLRKVNKKVIESLILSGAFDSFGHYRAQLMASLEDILNFGQSVQKEKSSPQLSLFGGKKSVTKTSINTPELQKISEWDQKQLLSFEKDLLGFYITGHPLDAHKNILEKYTNSNAISIKEICDGSALRIGGIIKSKKIIKTKKGDQMAFITIEDIYGSIEVIIFSNLFQSVSEILIEDNPIIVQGVIQKDENTIKILADMIIPISKAAQTWSESIHFIVDISKTTRETLVRFNDILKKYQGSCKEVRIHLFEPQKTETIIALPENFGLRCDNAMIREVNGLFGYKAVETVCSSITIQQPSNNNFKKNNKQIRRI